MELFGLLVLIPHTTSTPLIHKGLTWAIGFNSFNSFNSFNF